MKIRESPGLFKYSGRLTWKAFLYSVFKTGSSGPVEDPAIRGAEREGSAVTCSLIFCANPKDILMVRCHLAGYYCIRTEKSLKILLILSNK